MKVLVNLITTLRFVYTLLLPLIKAKVSRNAFIINIVVLFLTDTIDGFLARKFKVQTVYGSIMDTIADKTLSIILLIILLSEMKMMSIILALEIVIAIVNCIGMKAGKFTRSSYFGKVKTWFLASSIIFSFLYYFNVVDIKLVIISSILTVFLQLITFINYIRSLISQKDIVREKHKIHNIKDLGYVLFNTEYYLTKYTETK